MAVIIIVVENLRIGGYQRLALDQSYLLADRGDSFLLLLLNPNDSGLRSFEDTEKILIEQKRIDIHRLAGNRIKDLFTIRKFLKQRDEPVLVLSHSLRASVLFTLARICGKSDITIHTTIHQLPALSAPTQRFKRFLYAQFTDKLFGYSAAVCSDWQSRYRFFGKPITLLRNGVYLPRLSQKGVQGTSASGKSRLIYLGRNTGWKGVHFYLSLFKKAQFSDFEGLMMISEISLEIQKEIRRIGKDRIKLEVGANLSEYLPRPGDLHVYATDYGKKSKFSEPISLNCLEMAAIGVKSLVSKSNSNTWPELTSTNIFVELDWVDIDSFDLSTYEHSLPTHLTKYIRDVVSVENNLKNHLEIWALR